MLKLNEDRQHFSFSQLATMLSCPHKYRLQYVEGRDWDYVPSQIPFGTAIHETIREYHKKLQKGSAKDTAEFPQTFRSAFTQQASKDNVVFKDDTEFSELLQKGEALINQYVDTFQHLEPLEVEMEFRLPLVNTYTGEMLNKDIVGKVDLITEGAEIYEIKTGSAAMPETSADENLQLILYGWAYKITYGRAPQKLVLVNLIKTKKPKIQVLETSTDAQKERKLLHLMFSVNQAIEKEAFYPNPRASFGCGSCCYGMSCEWAI